MTVGIEARSGFVHRISGQVIGKTDKIRDFFAKGAIDLHLDKVNEALESSVTETKSVSCALLNAWSEERFNRKALSESSNARARRALLLRLGFSDVNLTTKENEWTDIGSNISTSYSSSATHDRLYLVRQRKPFSVAEFFAVSESENKLREYLGILTP